MVLYKQTAKLLLADYSDENNSTSVDPYTTRYPSIDPAAYVGRLPSGSYRLIKEFRLYDNDADLLPNNRVRYLSKEFAVLDFSVTD